MRLKDYHEKEGKRVWLSESEIQLLLENCDDDHVKMQAAMMLAARCGLRREEIVHVTPSDIQHTDIGTVVRVWEGKGGKYREPPAPDELSTLALGISNGPDEPLVDSDPSTIYTWVRRSADRCLAETGDEGWQFVGPHDLRRSWGVRLLENGVVPSVVMEWGGWEDWQTFRDHYLSEFSPEALRRERGKVSWLGHETKMESQQSYAVLPGSARPSSGRQPQG
jgi:integrase